MRCAQGSFAYDHGRLGIAIGCNQWGSFQDDVLRYVLSSRPFITVRIFAHRCDVLHAAIHIQHEVRGVCIPSLPAELFLPGKMVSVTIRPQENGLPTVRSLMSVDFPAPLGPITPTRLLSIAIKELSYHFIIWD